MTEVIPGGALAQHVAILGKTGSGKTSTAKLAIEQVVAAGARICVLDPIKSDWWGLISSADGKSAGLPFHILGGPRGHVPLHENAGKPIGELVASGALPLSILDMADFPAGGLQRFFVDFAAVLIRRMRGVLYLVIEEAHEFAPKERTGFDKENLAIHFAKKLATAGRSKGIRLVLLSQRTQSLHNALLGSCDTLIAHRFTAPADQAPVVKWLQANVEPEIAKKVAWSMSSLKTGEGWICSGEARIFEQRKFPRIQTYDNTATPTGDADAQHDVATAAVDLERLRAVVGDAVRDAEANDPQALHAEIARLKRELAFKPGAGAETPSQVAEREAAHARDTSDAYERGRADTLEQVRSQAEALERLATGALDTAKALKAPTFVPSTRTRAREEEKRPTKPDITAPRIPSHNYHPPRREAKILNALAELEQLGVAQPERVQVAFLAGYTHISSKGFANAIGAARSDGLIEYPATGRIALTAEGRRLAKAPPKPSIPAELQDRLLRLLGGVHARVLQPLIAAYPKPIERDDLAGRAGYTHTASKGFANAIGRLRSLGFIDYPTPGRVVAQRVLFLGG